MPEISQFISPEVTKQQADYLAKMEAIKNSYIAATKESMLLLQTVDKLNVNSKNTAEVQKKLNESVGKATEVNKNLKNIEIEREKVQKQLRDTLSKNLIAEEKSTVILRKGKIALQEKAKASKNLILAQKAERGSTEQLAAVNRILEQRLRKVNQTTDEGIKKAKLLTSAIDKNNKKITAQSSAFVKTKRNIGNYGGAIKRVAMQFAGALGLTSVVFMFINVLKGSFNTIREFTKQNAVLAGVLGKTRKEITQLTDQAIQLGSIYPVTASEVNKLQVSFARLGFTQAEIINLTEATIQGSIALNSSLDQTATLVGAVVKAYQDLGTEDAGDIIDKLTLSTQKSSLSFAALETALPKVAAASSAMNIPLSKTLTHLGIINDATLDASITGTSLRNIYLELAKTGLTLDEALAKINGSSNKLAESFNLFGKRGAIAGLALANAGDSADKFEEAVDNAGGTAERVAETQMATLDGAIKGLQSSWEKFVLSAKGSEGVFSAITNAISSKLDVMSDKYATTFQKIRSYFNLGFMSKGVLRDINARNDLLSFIEKSSKTQIEAELKFNQELLDDNEKFNTDVIAAVKRRIEQIEQQEKDLLTRQKGAEDNAKVAKLAFLDELAILNKSGIEKEIESVTQKYNRLISKAESFKLDITGLEQQLVNEIAKIRKEISDKEASERIKAMGDLLDAEIKYQAELEKHADEQEKSLMAQYDAEQAIIDKALDNEIKANIAANKKILEDAEYRAEKEKELQTELSEAKQELIQQGIDNIFEINEGANERKLEQLENEKQNILSNEKLTSEERAAIEADFAKRENEIKKKQKTVNKIQAAIDVGISTAKSLFEIKATAAVLLSNPLTALLAPLALAQIPFLLASSGISLAAIAAFAKGTDNAPMQGLFGEKGSELMRTIGGEFIHADKPTVFSGQEFKGAKIWNAGETKEIMSGMSNGIVKGKNIDTLINISLAKHYEKGFGEMANEYRKGTKQIVSALNKKQTSYNPRAKKITERSGNTVKHYYDVFK